MIESKNFFHLEERRYEFIEIYNSFQTKEIGTWRTCSDDLLIQLPILYSIDHKYEYIELFTFRYTLEGKFVWVNTFDLKEEISHVILEKLSDIIIKQEKEIFSEKRVKADQLRNLFSA